MSRVWLQCLLFVFVVVCAGAIPTAPARAQSVIPGRENGYVAPPILAPPPDIASYERPSFAKIEWPLIPERFCSEAEKAAFLADLNRRIALANANFDLADEFREYADRWAKASAAAGASRGYVSMLTREFEQLSQLRAFHLDVLSTWTRIAARLKGLPVTNCAPATDGPPPVPQPGPLPPPPSSITPEGYFTGPVTAGLPPEPGPDLRPDFAPIEFLPVATAFCTEAQKRAYLAEVADLVALAGLNYQLAFYYQRNAVGRARLYAEAGRAAEAAVWDAEAKAYEPIVEYHRDVLDTWLTIQRRVSALPVIDCDRPIDPGKFPDPVKPPADAPVPGDDFVQPSKDPNGNPYRLPDIPERFCSVEERRAYVAGTFDPMIREARQAAEDAYRAVEAARKRLEEGKATRQEVEAITATWMSLSSRATMLVYLRQEIFERPIVDCTRPGSQGRVVPEDFVQPSQDIRGNAFNLPDIPDRFCTEADRAAYLAGTFDPMLAAERAKALAARARYEKAKAAYERTGQGMNALLDPKVQELYREFLSAAFDADYLEERVQRLEALREQILKQPIDPCGPEDEPAPEDAYDLISAPAQMDAAVTPAPLLDLPRQFCTEGERLAYLTDVYHSLAQAASQAAVEAYRKLDDLYALLAGAQRYGSPLGTSIFEEEINRQRLEAQELAARARALIALRDVILRIPIVPCPKDRDADREDDGGPPTERTAPFTPATPPGPAIPPAAQNVRAPSSFEQQVLEEINLLRSDPAAYAQYLPGVIRGARPADVAAAVAALKAASPAPPLTFNQSLAGAAISHADDIGPAGLTGHTGTDGSTLGARIREFGLIASLTAEELSYGQGSARAVVVQFVIDAGVAGAPHRRDLLNPVFRMAGVGCGPHKSFGKMCVITLSGPPVDRSG